MSQSVSLSVLGMKCGGCESSVNEKVSSLDGVISVTANHKENSVDIEFDDNKISLDAITGVISSAGFEIK